MSPPPGESGDFLTTNQGVRLSDNHNSLKAGPRGPALLEDFVLREKITHFDHERIPERIVHARGAGAFGTFECTKKMTKFTSAGFLSAVGKKTPVLTRFSTVAGSRGSADTARDARGFAVKFYTDEGNYDFVGNNIPVFFIQDAMKFPDLIHAIKPEPHNEIPQAASAHDTFWDFISLMPESMHMIFWVMSDRAIPRSLRMMEGFGVHTFKLINDEGKPSFVKFHWKPRLGVHSLTWEESMNIMGHDGDFHRRDLWENIDQGNFPQWDLGLQIVPEEDEFKFDFDLLDPTKLIPEELVPVELVGTMTLDRNPDNFFSEIEQAAFHPGHLVPGLDVSNDPLLQGRLFSYTDTQLIRLGGPNFHQLPVNRPLAPVNNHQRDGFGQQLIPSGRVAYEPNSLGGGCPFHSPEKMKSYVHHTERVDAHKVRARSTSFGDHFSQARMFFQSQDPIEQGHIRDAISFELSKVETEAVRERVLGLISQVDRDLAAAISGKVGVAVPKDFSIPPNPADPENNIIPPNRSLEMAKEDDVSISKKAVKSPKTSRALSIIKNDPKNLLTRKFAFLVGDGVDAGMVTALKSALEKEGAKVDLVGPRMGEFPAKGGKKIKADQSLDIVSAFLYDAVFIPGGASGNALAASGPAIRFVAQAYKQCKSIGAGGEGNAVVEAALRPFLKGGAKPWTDVGVNSAGAKTFVEASKPFRDWAREASTKNMPV
ncbi:MAG: catalase [Cryobacterium sp.]|nr:catalase [Oligoflexia bacterium]